MILFLQILVLNKFFPVTIVKSLIMTLLVINSDKPTCIDLVLTNSPWQFPTTLETGLLGFSQDESGCNLNKNFLIRNQKWFLIETTSTSIEMNLKRKLQIRLPFAVSSIFFPVMSKWLTCFGLFSSFWTIHLWPMKKYLCQENNSPPFFRSSRPEVFLRKGVLKVCRKFTGEREEQSKAKQLYWNHTSAWVFSCKFATIVQNTFS